MSDLEAAADPVAEPVKEVDLPTQLLSICEEVAANQTLADSLDTMFARLFDVFAQRPSEDVIAALLGLVRDPLDQNRQVALKDLLRECLTRGTSHVGVVPGDPLVDQCRFVLELPRKDRAAHVTTMRLAFQQPELDKAAAIATLETAAAAKDAQIADLQKVIESKEAESADLQARIEAKEAESADLRAELADVTVELEDLAATAELAQPAKG
jgi:hypothetical protein